MLINALTLPIFIYAILEELPSKAGNIEIITIVNPKT